MVRCDLSATALLDEDEAGWSLVLQSGRRQLSEEQAKPAVPELGELLDHAMGSGDLSVLRSEDSPVFFREAGVRSLAVIPILTLRSRIGLLLVGKGPDESFSGDDSFILRTLADHFAVAIENLRLHRRLERHSEELEELVEERTTELQKSEQRQRVLLDVNNSIVVNLDRESLFDATLQSLRGLLDFDLAALALLDSAGDSIRIWALATESAEGMHVGDEFLRAGSHLQPAIDEKKPHIRGDLEKGTRVGREDLLLQQGIRSYVAVPLVAKGRTLGALCLASKTPHRYSPEDADLLLELAGQVALAVDNMRAYEEIADLKARLQQESLYLQEEIKLGHNFEEIIGSSQGLRSTLERVDAVAPTDSTVLILGETGTGKELIARAIHDRSRRSQRALVKVNCAALPSGLIESELFGHERGAFTGATKRRTGRFELADRGTLFLDEVGDIPAEVQVKLLRVLQEGEIERVGGTETIRVDVRVVAATNLNLAKAVEARTFRSDLFYRLNVFPIELPPLRERSEDIQVLARYFADKYAAEMRKRITSFSEKSLSRLQTYPWPGNVRELGSVIERAVIMARGSELEIDLEIPGTRKGSSSITARGSSLGQQTLAEAERGYIIEALTACGGAIAGPKGAANLLGLNPSTLRSRMKKLGIPGQGS